jgi:predicted negative regulator of RcsB-dependent stress response
VTAYTTQVFDEAPASDTPFLPDDLSPLVVHSAPVAEALVEKRQRRTGLLIGGIAAVMLVALVAGIAFMTTRNNGLRQMPTASAVAPTPVLQLYAIPRKTVDDARRVLENNPHDPLAHLTLARAQLVAGNLLEARNTLEAGYADADDKVRYILSGAAAAEEDHLPAAALVIYDRAVQEAQRQNDRWQTVRAYAGEAMYRIAGQNTFGPLEMRTFTALTPGPSALLQIAVARIQIDQNRLNPAENQLKRILTAQDLPEAHLVLGEVYAAQGHRDQAASEWRIARDAPDTPAWAAERATALLDSTI